MQNPPQDLTDHSVSLLAYHISSRRAGSSIERQRLAVNLPRVVVADPTSPTPKQLALDVSEDDALVKVEGALE